MNNLTPNLSATMQRITFTYQRNQLIENKPELALLVGIGTLGLYMHNPKTGFNETIDPITAEFTGKYPN